ncbi:MAG: hypothetical protein HYU27_06215 [Acidobacteria bacterium]|nr:hypothetical protein [Acidobacteriota bacterium]
MTLGAGYLVALFNLYVTYHLTDGQPGLTVGDLKRSFYGDRENTRLAAKIDGGSMEEYLPRPGDKEKILSWIQDGAKMEGYAAAVAPILKDNCVRCHNPNSLVVFRPLTTYDEVLTVVEIDRGEPVALWARVAHTHIQSIGLIFLAAGIVFSMTSIPERWKTALIGCTYGSLFLDFGSRFLVKYEPNLVYLMMAAGAVMGLCFGLLLLIPLYEMWIAGDRRQPETGPAD